MDFRLNSVLIVLVWITVFFDEVAAYSNNSYYTYRIVGGLCSAVFWIIVIISCCVCYRRRQANRQQVQWAYGNNPNMVAQPMVYGAPAQGPQQTQYGLQQPTQFGGPQSQNQYPSAPPNANYPTQGGAPMGMDYKAPPPAYSEVAGPPAYSQNHI